MRRLVRPLCTHLFSLFPSFSLTLRTKLIVYSPSPPYHPYYIYYLLNLKGKTLFAACPPALTSISMDMGTKRPPLPLGC